MKPILPTYRVDGVLEENPWWAYGWTPIEIYDLFRPIDFNIGRFP